MSLGKKLLLGFLIPVLMLLASGIWSWARFHNLSQSVQALLHENDRSIQAARDMSIALERMDSAILLRISGETATADTLDHAAQAAFEAALDVAVNNVTILAEPAILDSIKASYLEFRTLEEALRSKRDIKTYQSEMMPAFLRVTHSVDRLRRVNQDEMYGEAIHIADEAFRATLPGRILVIAAIIFTLMFAWLLHEHTVKPLNKLLHAVKRWPTTEHFRKPDVHSGDEIEELAESLDIVERTFGGRNKK